MSFASLAGFALLLQSQAAPAAAPSRSLALLPVIHASGEKWQELKESQIKKIEEYARQEFPKRGIAVVPSETVEGALKELNLDMTDEENHRRGPLFDVGRKLGVDYVLFTVVTETSQKQQERLFYKDIEGQATLKTWLLDVKAEKPILSGAVKVGRSGGNRVGDGKGSSRQIQAAANALRDSLKPFFDSLPKP